MKQEIKISGFSDEISSDLEQQILSVQQLGINYICLRGVEGKNIGEFEEDEFEEKVLKILEKHQIGVSSIGSTLGKIFIDDDLGFQNQLKMAGRIKDYANRLGCKYVRIFSFYIPENKSAESYREEVFAKVKEFLSVFEQGNIIVLHENEKDIFGDSADRCIELMENICSPYFRAAFDFANFVQVGEDPERAFKMLEPYIVYFHIKDAQYGNKENVACGEGDGKIEEILKAGIQKGYKGFLTLEPHLTKFQGRDGLELHKEPVRQDVAAEDGFLSFRRQYEGLCKILERIKAEE